VFLFTSNTEIMNTTFTVNLFRNKTKLKIAFGLVLSLSSVSLFSQTANSDFERIKLETNDSEYTGIAISPDQNTIAFSFKKPAMVELMDWSSRKVIRKFDAGNWLTGSTVRFSDKGKYLIIQEIGYSDFSQNKDRAIDFELVDVASGSMVKKFGKVQDVVISPDETKAASLNNDEITIYNLPSGNKEKSFSIVGAANALALSADGKTLAVSQIVNPDDFKKQFGKDSKGLKNVAKFKQVVGLFNADTGAKIKTIGEFYDIVYQLSFLPEADILFVYQTPDIRIQVNNKNLSYVNLIDMVKMEPIRRGFTSMSLTQPDLKISDDHKAFAINSKGTRFQEMHLYNYETGEIEKRFELGHRIFEKVDGEKLINGSRPAFIFLPDNQSILIAMGNQLIKWNIEFNNDKL
jgi:hypothetical protein